MDVETHARSRLHPKLRAIPTRLTVSVPADALRAAPCICLRSRPACLSLRTTELSFALLGLLGMVLPPTTNSCEYMAVPSRPACSGADGTDSSERQR